MASQDPYAPGSSSRLQNPPSSASDETVPLLRQSLLVGDVVIAVGPPPTSIVNSPQTNPVDNQSIQLSAPSVQRYRMHCVSDTIMSEVFPEESFDPSWPFFLPMDRYGTIEKPMDLGILRRKIGACEYETPEEFKADVHLLFANCFRYNKTDLGSLRLQHRIMTRINELFHLNTAAQRKSPASRGHNNSSPIVIDILSSSDSDSDSEDMTLARIAEAMSEVYSDSGDESGQQTQDSAQVHYVYDVSDTSSNSDLPDSEDVTGEPTGNLAQVPSDYEGSDAGSNWGSISSNSNLADPENESDVERVTSEQNNPAVSHSASSVGQRRNGSVAAAQGSSANGVSGADSMDSEDERATKPKIVQEQSISIRWSSATPPSNQMPLTNTSQNKEHVQVDSGESSIELVLDNAGERQFQKSSYGDEIFIQRKFTDSEHSLCLKNQNGATISVEEADLESMLTFFGMSKDFILCINKETIETMMRLSPEETYGSFLKMSDLDEVEEVAVPPKMIKTVTLDDEDDAMTSKTPVQEDMEFEVEELKRKKTILERRQACLLRREELAVEKLTLAKKRRCSSAVAECEAEAEEISRQVTEVEESLLANLEKEKEKHKALLRLESQYVSVHRREEDDVSCVEFSTTIQPENPKLIDVKTKLFEEAFQRILRVRNFKGEVIVDHVKKQILIKAHSGGESAEAKPLTDEVDGIATFSDGTKAFFTVAFMLALWKFSEQAFILIDDLEYFMDIPMPFNKEHQEMKLLLDAFSEMAQAKPDGQFVLFTDVSIPYVETFVRPSSSVTAAAPNGQI